MNKKKVIGSLFMVLCLVVVLCIGLYASATPLLGCCANCSCNCGECGACGGPEDKEAQPSNIFFIGGLGELARTLIKKKKHI